MEVLGLGYHSAATALQRKTFIAARAIRNGQKGEGDERAAEETVAKKKGGDAMSVRLTYRSAAADLLIKSFKVTRGPKTTEGVEKDVKCEMERFQ